MFLTVGSFAHAGTVPLHKLNERDQQARLARDVAAARIYRDGLHTTLEFVMTHPELFPTQDVKEPRLLTREQKEAVWSAWKSFLDYTLALDALGRYHRRYYRLKGAAEDRAFLVAYASFLAQYRAALEFLDRTEHDPGFDALLNEPVPELGLEKGTFAKVKFRFLNAGRGTEFVALEALYKAKRIQGDPELRQRIAEDREAIWRMGRGRGQALTAKNALRVVKNAGFTAYFPVQAGVSEWMGDTKVWRPNHSLISSEQIASLTKRLEPGDVLLERREWYLSNVGLPGFWPHAALFIGTVEDRRRYFDDADVKAWVKEHGQAEGDFEALLKSRYPNAYALASRAQEHGHLPRVIEAISEGVSFTTMEHSADCDSLAALRPRLPKREKAQAILRAFHYAGRPYDFNFDFRTDSTLVCTELVYKSYEPATGLRGLKLPMVQMMNRPVLPANEIVRQFVEDYGTARQQWELVAFLDGDERGKRAVEADVKTFCESCKRPKWHVLAKEEVDEE